MKQRFALCAALLLILASSMVQAAKPEFRGIQVHTWIPGMLSPAEIDQTVKWAKDANFNVLIMQVRRVGDACYNSAYEPRASSLKDQPDFDPLAYSIKKGHENGMPVYAWFNVYRIWAAGKPSDPKHVVNQHPDWLNKDINGADGSSDGKFLDPGNPEARAYTIKVLGDMLSKYDVDGVMLDFVRYPGQTWGYTDSALSQFNAKYHRTGKPDPTDPDWCAWRRAQVTEMVKGIYKEINRQKPRVALAAATVTWGACAPTWEKTDAYAYVFQDWRLWMEQHILDVNMPMNYHDPAKGEVVYADWLEHFKQWSYGRYVASTAMVFKGNVPGAGDQLKLARDHGLAGSVGFAYSQGETSDELGKYIRANVFTQPAPVPVLPWKAKAPKTSAKK